MYVSVRDVVVLWVWPTIEEGLREMRLDALELLFNRDCEARLPAPKNGETHLVLSDPRQADEFHAELQAKGIRASALLMATDFSRDEVDQEVQWVVNAVRAAERIGAEALRIDAHMRKEGEWPLDKRISLFADCMKKVLDATSDSKIEMGIENHGLQGNTPEFLDRVLNSVGSDRLGITMDTGNFYWAGHPLDKVYEILEHFAPRTKHTHCKNIRYPEDMRNIRREPGWEYAKRACPMRQGDIDHRRVAEILRKAGYKRGLCIEDESLPGLATDQEKRAAAIDDADYLREAVAGDS